MLKVYLPWVDEHVPQASHKQLIKKSMMVGKFQSLNLLFLHNTVMHSSLW